jgi:hypothetical protein
VSLPSMVTSRMNGTGTYMETEDRPGAAHTRRPPKLLTAHERQETFQRLANGESQADIARTYAVHPATIGRMLGNAGSPFADASGAAA